MNDGLEAATECRETIDEPAVGTGTADLLDQTELLHLAEAFGEQVGGDPRQPAQQIGIAQRSEQQIADDEQRPSFADDVERFGEPTVLIVRPAFHATILTISIDSETLLYISSAVNPIEAPPCQAPPHSRGLGDAPRRIRSAHARSRRLFVAAVCWSSLRTGVGPARAARRQCSRRRRRPLDRRHGRGGGSRPAAFRAAAHHGCRHRCQHRALDRARALPVGKRIAIGLPIAALVGYQSFRIIVELLMHRAYVEGLMPVQMSYSGRNFDIVTGITALALGGLARHGTRSRGLVLAWNTLGVVLLANILIVALLSAPTPFRVFMNEPANVWITHAPWVWLPTVMVFAAVFGHVAVYRRLAAAIA